MADNYTKRKTMRPNERGDEQRYVLRATESQMQAAAKPFNIYIDTNLHSEAEYALGEEAHRALRSILESAQLFDPAPTDQGPRTCSDSCPTCGSIGPEYAKADGLAAPIATCPDPFHDPCRPTDQGAEGLVRVKADDLRTLIRDIDGNPVGVAEFTAAYGRLRAALADEGETGDE